jgi:tryptophan-rich sensory protein
MFITLFLVFLAACFAAGATGALFQPGEWYRSLRKPSWTPPDWLFPGAWTVLYLSMAAAAARIAMLAVFGAVAVLSFFYVAEFLALRGLAAHILLAAGPLLTSAFGEYDIPARLFMVSIVYLALTVAIVLGAQPWRMRDAIEWLQRMPGRARVAGSALTAYGLLLVGVAFTY